MSSAAVRSAVYMVFAIRWIGQWTRRILVVLIGLLGIYILSVWVYCAEPWYDRAVIRQLARIPHMAPQEDLSEQAARTFPNGMPRHAAMALLHSNGFACDGHENESVGGAHRLLCRREPHVLLCAARYTVELGFDEKERVNDRSANSYIVCL